jgi:hypothetical protein
MNAKQQIDEIWKNPLLTHQDKDALVGELKSVAVFELLNPRLPHSFSDGPFSIVISSASRSGAEIHCWISLKVGGEIVPIDSHVVILNPPLQVINKDGVPRYDPLMAIEKCILDVVIHHCGSDL